MATPLPPLPHPLPPLPASLSPYKLSQHSPQAPPPIPLAPERKYYSRELTPIENKRRQEILSKTVSITPKKPFAALTFSFQDLYKFIIESFAKHHTGLEGTVLIGGAAAYVLSSLPYADIDVSFYIGHQSDRLDESQRKIMFDWISLEIKRFIQERLKATGIHLDLIQIDQNYFQKKIFINKDSDCFSLFALGDVELKFIYKKPRHNVSTSDGFQVSLTNGVRCINGDTFCEQDEFERAEEALKYRYFDVNNPQEVMGLPFRLIQKFTQGFEVRQSEVVKEALAQLRKETHEQEDRLRFCKQMHQHHENHYPNSIIGKAADLLNWCHFLLQLESPQERHLYHTDLASAWLDGNKKPLLDHFATLLKQDSELAQHLLAVIHGCFLYQWLNGNKYISVYPISQPNEKPRFFIVIQEGCLTHHLLIPPPQEIIIDFCRSLRILEETQQQLDREALPIDLSLISLMPDIGFEPHPKEVMLPLLIESIEKGPFAEVLRHQFNGAFSARSCYQSLMEELNPNERRLISFRQISSHLKHLVSEPIAENDIKLLLSAALEALPVENTPESAEKLKCFQLQLHGKTIVDPVQKRWITETILYIVQKIDENKQYCLYHTLHRLIESAQTLLPPAEYSRIHSLLLKNDALLIDQFVFLCDSVSGQAERIALVTNTLLTYERLKSRSKTPSEISLWIESSIRFLNKIFASTPFPELEEQMCVLFKECLQEVLTMRPTREIDAIAVLAINLLKSNPKRLEPYSSLLFDLAHLLLKHSQQSDLYLQLVARLGRSVPDEKVQIESHRRLLDFLSKLFVEKKSSKSIKQQTIAIIETLGMSKVTLQQLKEIDFGKQLCKVLSLCLPLIAVRNLRLANETLREFRTNVHLSADDQQDLWVAVLDLVQRNARQNPQFGSAGGVAFQMWVENQLFINEPGRPVDAGILATQISTLSTVLDAVLSSPKGEERLERANSLMNHLVKTMKKGASIALTPEQRMGISEPLSSTVNTLFQKEFPVESIQKLLFLNDTIPAESDAHLNPCLSPDSIDDALLKLLQIYATRPPSNPKTLQSLLEIMLNFRTKETSHLKDEKLEPVFKAFEAIKTSNDLQAMQSALDSLQAFALQNKQNKQVHSTLIDLQLAIISIHLNKLLYEEAYTLLKRLLDVIELNEKKDELALPYGSTMCSTLKSLIHGISNDKKMKEFEQVRLVDCFTALNKNKFLEHASPENRLALLTEICQCKQFIWWKTALQQLKECQELDPSQFSSLSETLLKGVLECRDCPDEAVREAFIREFIAVAGSKTPRVHRIVFEHATDTSNSAYFNLINECPFSSEALLLADKAALYNAVIQYLYILTMQSFKDKEAAQDNVYSDALQNVWAASISILSQNAFQEQSIKSGTCILQLFGEFPLPSFVTIASHVFLTERCKDLKKAAKLILKGFTKIPDKISIDTFKFNLGPVLALIIKHQLFDAKQKDLSPFLTLFGALIAPENAVDAAFFFKTQKLFDKWLKVISLKTIGTSQKIEEGLDDESKKQMWTVYEQIIRHDYYQPVDDMIPFYFLTVDQALTVYYIYSSKTLSKECSIDVLRPIVKRVIDAASADKGSRLNEIRHLASLLIKRLVAVKTFEADVLALEVRHTIVSEAIYEPQPDSPNQPSGEELLQELTHLHQLILDRLIEIMQKHDQAPPTTENYVAQLINALPSFSTFFPEKATPFYIAMIDTLFNRGKFLQSAQLMSQVEVANLFDKNREKQDQLHEAFIEELYARCANKKREFPSTKNITTMFQELTTVYTLNLIEKHHDSLTLTLRSIMEPLIRKLVEINPSTKTAHYATTAMALACQLNLFEPDAHEQNFKTRGSFWAFLGSHLMKLVKCMRKKDPDVEQFAKWFVNLHPILINEMPECVHEILKELCSKFDFSVSRSSCTLGQRLQEATANYQIIIEGGPITPLNASSYPQQEAVLEFPLLDEEEERGPLFKEGAGGELEIEHFVTPPRELRISASWEDVLAADEARKTQQLLKTIFEYLKGNKKETFADVEIRLRKENRYAYLVATKTGIPAGSVVRGANGARCKYLIWASTELPEIALQKKQTIMDTFCKAGTPEERDALNLENLRNAGIAHLK